MNPVQLRQAVIACETQDSYRQFQMLLGLGKPYHDPGVSEFGLDNAVFAIGNQFLEIVVPMSDNAPAKRFIDRSGPGGYMAIFQTDEIALARARIKDLGIRSVWDIDLEDIAATHMHPADIGGAIVSIDEANPPESWRWAGEGWENRSAPGRINGVKLVSPEPELLAEKWSAALDLDMHQMGENYLLSLGNGVIVIATGETEKMDQISLAVPDPNVITARARNMDLPIDDYENAIEFAGFSIALAPIEV